MSIRNNGRERKHFKLTEKDKQYIRETCKKMRIEQVNENEPAIDECAFKGNEVLTSYVIDTTKTRLSLVLIYTAGLAIGIVCIWTYIRKRRI